MGSETRAITVLKIQASGESVEVPERVGSSPEGLRAYAEEWDKRLGTSNPYSAKLRRIANAIEG